MFKSLLEHTKKHTYALLTMFFVVYFFYLSLEERQRAEKRTRETKGQKFTPRWFDLTDEITSTPWGDIEIYQYNGKYNEHRDAAASSSGASNADDLKSIEFNPWQYGNVSTE